MEKCRALWHFKFFERNIVKFKTKIGGKNQFNGCATKPYADL